MVALFRIERLVSGSMFIDGVDIETVPLTTLRSKLGIVPQDAVMFSASVRFNLDPFNKYSDSDLWHVLECVRMKDMVTNLPLKLEEQVVEGGE